MDGMLQYLVNLSAFVILMFLIILIAHKMNGFNLQNMGIYKYAKVIEKVSISKDTFLIVLKTGDEGCVLLISPNNVERVRDLNKADLEEIENSKKSSNKLKFDTSKFTKVKFNRIRFKKNMYNTMDVINKLEEKEDANIK
ncbi:flagellar biosynthetic protein FliO [Paraclostridium sordellii]|uniref:flagellar biosynthetic protein FliO n=1 Tax=Paraclostridium sordellii TaxID=1505 RepID=UPI0022E4A113|nr:flagellar biosynthetic protein FliO [Paeniclostridium sordellii]